jgi:hypothetical protein
LPFDEHSLNDRFHVDIVQTDRAPLLHPVSLRLAEPTGAFENFALICRSIILSTTHWNSVSKADAP